ncbi:ABC transporter permease [Roseicyclus mahoneyensis]|uniref:NitT/TauT family transport system permease protein n=1 Tax=Roseicyclus mahoneyensis TaxID=164332 RepID=A0A316GJM6_9RHOB|nr:ABC transporter permease [Roseicyclus mahoneyensis]PWK60457.1 NitT/TauT family transport system permease protein [Roseicyclus mahoneyensis]
MRAASLPPWGLPALGAGLIALALVSDTRLAVILAVWFGAWALNAALANRSGAGATRLVVPVIFGVTLLVLWELVVQLYQISFVILPAPSAIWARMVTETPTLWADFQQTILKGALAGYVMGCGAAFLAALAIDRSAFLQRGLLPVGNFIAALPIVGTAPIFVMWFGFGWQSKSAVVVAMVFFPMLVNCVQGFKASDVMQRDLMRTYAASYGQTLVKLRLPTAMPFIFNGLKICTTLALIGAIVAEFFGSPTVGMGFRIKIEMGRLAMDMVWAEIAVAALAGSGFYGLVALIEKRLTFWHPSQRRG